MARFSKILSCLVLGLTFWAHPQKFSQTRFQSATFGPSREFWPLKKAVGDSLPKIAVLPLSLSQIKESKPCDSCHWISKNGVEFVLENQLVKLCREMEAEENCEWIPPHHDLISGGKIDLLNTLNNLDIPWDKYFSDYGFPLIHRGRDKLSSASTRQMLSKLAGTLGVRYLLLGQKLSLQVDPVSSSSHQGNYRFQFYLMLWQLGSSGPLWVLKADIESISTDLDKPFGDLFREAVIRHLQQLPQQLHAYLAAEPK